MKVLTCKITIGVLSFNWVNSIESESAWEVLTDRAKIVIPRTIIVNNNQVTEYLKTGDSVQIEIGYDERLHTIFKGYVTHIKPRVPIEISCEDSMWKLKQLNIIDHSRAGDLKTVLQKYFNNFEMDVLETKVPGIYIDNLSGSKLLEKLKSEYKLYSFFRGDKLIIGKQYDKITANKVSFKLHFDINDDDLIFKTKDQINLQVKAISNNSNGSKHEIEVGEKFGESKTLKFYNLSKSELKKVADREYSRLMFDGWRGSFTAFGEPFVKHGDIVEITYEQEHEKTGSYWVDSVEYKFGLKGYRQIIKLGAKV